jgi:hypothetical protein
VDREAWVWLERWLTQQAATLGKLVIEPDSPRTNLVELSPDSEEWLTLERIDHVAGVLDGHQGRNRASGFCLISARNDLEALQAYLYRYRDQDKTLRAYQKELERFLLWCIRRERVALSSLGTDECERYKDFLANLPLDWIFPRVTRTSSRWRTPA